jgi:hypothetical protein
MNKEIAMQFESGQSVRCIDAEGTSSGLEKDKVYQVRKFEPLPNAHGEEVLWVVGGWCPWLARRFVKA